MDRVKEEDGTEYERMKATIRTMYARGLFAATPTTEERANWAYGNTRLANDAVTHEMAEQAAKAEPNVRG